MAFHEKLDFHQHCHGTQYSPLFCILQGMYSRYDLITQLFQRVAGFVKYNLQSVKRTLIFVKRFISFAKRIYKHEIPLLDFHHTVYCRGFTVYSR